MTVVEARQARVCRVCGKPIATPPGSPLGWQDEFGEMVYPVRVTLRFGEEFAHTECLRVTGSPSEPERPKP